MASDEKRGRLISRGEQESQQVLRGLGICMDGRLAIRSLQTFAGLRERDEVKLAVQVSGRAPFWKSPIIHGSV